MEEKDRQDESRMIEDHLPVAHHLHSSCPHWRQSFPACYHAVCHEIERFDCFFFRCRRRFLLFLLLLPVQRKMTIPNRWRMRTRRRLKRRRSQVRMKGYIAASILDPSQAQQKEESGDPKTDAELEEEEKHEENDKGRETRERGDRRGMRMTTRRILL